MPAFPLRIRTNAKTSCRTRSYAWIILVTNLCYCELLANHEIAYWNVIVVEVIYGVKILVKMDSSTTDDDAKPKALLDGEARVKPQYVKQRSVQIIDPRPEVVEVREKHGPLYNAIPRMPLGLAIVCCLFNIVIPGVGELFCS